MSTRTRILFPVLLVWASVQASPAPAVPPEEALQALSAEIENYEMNQAVQSSAAAAAGACCLPDATCTITADGSECRSDGGVFQGDGSDCSISCPAFPASDVQLLSWVPRSAFPEAISQTNSANDCWGYVSPSGREYGIYGLFGGTGFVEVTDPENPVVVGYIDGPDSTWRDIKVFDEYAYAVSEAGLGLQIIDLTDMDNGNVTLHSTDTLGGFFFTAHNIAINTESGYAYTVLSDFVRGLMAIDLSNPTTPVVAGSWDEVDIHDVMVVTYDSGTYAGREIAFASCEENGFYIIDVTDKQNMFTRASLTYPNIRYAHQGWLTRDRRHFLLGDELDETQDSDVDTTTTHVFNVEDLDNPFWVTSFTSGLPSIDHNLYVRGDFVYEANYNSGLRIFDVSDVQNAQQVGFYDTFPENDDRDFSGAWSNYPFLPSGTILVSDRQHGLFMLDASEAAPQTIPTIELVPRAGQGNEITIAPGDVVAVDVMVSGWNPEQLQSVEVSIGGASLTSACGGTLSLFNADADENGACDPGNEDVCPTCPAELAAEHFDGIYLDDCRPDHFSKGTPSVPLDTITIDLANVHFGWFGQTTGTEDFGTSRYAGTFVFEMSNDAFGTFTLEPLAPPATTMLDDNGTPVIVNPLRIGATIHASVTNAYADIDGNGVRNLFDIFCILEGIAGDFSSCSFAQDDIEPCGGNGTINLLDVFAVLDAIGGELACCQAPS